MDVLSIYLNEFSLLLLVAHSLETASLLVLISLTATTTSRTHTLSGVTMFPASITHRKSSNKLGIYFVTVMFKTPLVFILFFIVLEDYFGKCVFETAKE